MPKRRGQKRWYILLSLAAVVIGLIMYASSYAEYQLEAARTSLKLPESAERYRQLIKATNPDASEGVVAKSALDASEIEATKHSMALYKKLEGEYTARLEVSDAWHAMQNDFPKNLADWTEEQWDTAQAFLEENADYLRDIRALAASGGPYYPLDFEDGFAIMLPHLGKLRDFARVLRIDAGLQARMGNWDGVMANLVAQSQFAKGINQEPILISQLVGMAINRMTVQTVMEIAPPGTLTPAMGARLVNALEGSRNPEQMASAMSMETNMGASIFESIRLGDQNTLDSFRGEFPPAARWLMSSMVGQIFVGLDEATYLDMMTPLADLARLPYYEAIDDLKAFDAQLANLPRYKPLSHMLIPSLTRAITAPAREEAEIGLLRIGLGLEQYHAEYGSFPASLEVLDSSGGLPLDPFSGQPFRYVPTGNGFTLYSIGLNLEDDGGRQDLNTGDLVWRGQQPE